MSSTQTHEEAITSIVAQDMPISYKRLPIKLYQVASALLKMMLNILIDDDETVDDDNNVVSNDDIDGEHVFISHN